MKVFLICLALMTIKVQSQELGRGIVNGIDLDQVGRELQGAGVVGHMHASSPRYQQWVFTYRDSQNFFKYINFPMVGLSPDAVEVLQTLNRHDKVRIKGMFSNSGAPIDHIWAFQIEVVEKYDKPVPRYRHGVTLPDDLLAQDYMEGKVHAIFAGGRAMVVEYKDAVVPVFVSDSQMAMTKDLYRHDIIGLHYQVKADPQRPMHLEIDESKEEPLKVIDAMVANHNRNFTIEGTLAKFPKSPQIIFDIYALRVVYPQGIYRNFTIVNFDDQQLFLDILAKLENLWEANKATARPDRNHYVNPEIRLRIKGVKNVTAPTQANPQVLVDKITDIEVL